MWTWVFHQCCCCRCCCRCEHFICSWSWIKITFIIIFSLLAASLLLFWLYSVSHIIGCGRKGSNSSRVVLLESTKCTHEKYVWCEYSIATPSHLYLFRAHMCTPSLPFVLHFYVVSSLCLSRVISGLVAVFHSLYLVWLIFIAARFISHSNEEKKRERFFSSSSSSSASSPPSPFSAIRFNENSLHGINDVDGKELQRKDKMLVLLCAVCTLPHGHTNKRLGV